MTLSDILAVKGTKVFTISPETTLDEVVRQLVSHRVGSLLVCRDGEAQADCLQGIVTERDILYCCARGDYDLTKLRVSEVLSTTLVTGAPGDSVEAIMGVTTTKRIRHLPVLAEGRLIGIISIGDVVKAQHDHLAMENRFMKDYIQS